MAPRAAATRAPLRRQLAPGVASSIKAQLRADVKRALRRHRTEGSVNEVEDIVATLVEDVGSGCGAAARHLLSFGGGTPARRSAPLPCYSEGRSADLRSQGVVDGPGDRAGRVHAGRADAIYEALKKSGVLRELGEL
jgi:hypothetical protein